MSTRKIVKLLQGAQEGISKRTKNIKGRHIKRIAFACAVLVSIPLLSQASSDQERPSVPLDAEQTKKMSHNLAKFSPTAKEEPKKIVIEVAPEPEPAPPEPAPQPEPPRPATTTRRTVASTRRQRVAPRSGSRANTAGNSWQQCVPFARELSGVQIRGYAGNISPNSQEASVGSVALFGGYGHAAVVTGVDGDNVTIKEANYVPGKITERTVPKSQLRGYVK